MRGINLVLPIKYDVSDGPYRTTKDLIQAQFQNLKSLFYTSKGERIMDINFGIGIQKFIFENISDSFLLKLRKEITEQISVYLPFLIIKDLRFDYIEQTHSLYIRLFFSLLGFKEIGEFNAVVQGS